MKHTGCLKQNPIGEKHWYYCNEYSINRKRQLVLFSGVHTQGFFDTSESFTRVY